MRKTVSAVVALALLLSVLAACGSAASVPASPTPGGTVGEPAEMTGQPTSVPTNSPEVPLNSEAPSESVPVSSESPEPTPAPSPEVTETPEPTPSPSPEVTETPEPTPSPSPEVTETPEPTPSPSPEVTEAPEPTPSPGPETTGTPAPSPSAPTESKEPEVSEEPYIDPAPVTSEPPTNEADALLNSPVAIPDLLAAEASGTLVKENSKAVIDYSNTADGYVMVKYIAETDKRLKVIVKGPATQYTYNLTQGEWTVFPLSDGSGQYKVGVYQSVGDKYASVLSLTCEVSLADEFAPFLRPNQYVDYSKSSTAVAKAAELTQDLTDPLKKVEAVYDYVVHAIIYDKAKASSVKSGYLPNLDQVMKDKKGICFDYAALMTAMLRSQNVPCKLVVGYAGTAYHAWISVWTAEHGWVDGVIYFDGSAWHRMDPTFASSGNQSADIMEYIGDGTNYTVKYLY